MVSDLQLMRPDPDCLITRNMCGFVRVKTRQFGQSEYQVICAPGVKASTFGDLPLQTL